MSKLLIASGNGRLYLFDSIANKIDIVFTNPNPNEWFMGLTKHEDHIIASSTLGIHLFRWYKKELKCISSIVNPSSINPRFQHIRTIGDIVLAPTLTSNSIFIIKIEDTKFSTIGAIKVARTLERTFFDHISDIVFDQDKIYVLLHKLADNPTTSRIIELTNSFKQEGYYNFGWNAFGLAVVQGDKYAICNHNSEYKIGGLIKNTKIVAQWSPKYTMMDIAMTKDSIFLVGMAILEKDDSTLNGGVIMELNHDYTIKSMSMYCGDGQFRGCMVIDEEDLTNNSDQLDSSSLDLKKRDDDNITIRIFGDKK